MGYKNGNHADATLLPAGRTFTPLCFMHFALPPEKLPFSFYLDVGCSMHWLVTSNSIMFIILQKDADQLRWNRLKFIE
jgi:hypothetical protein